MIAVARTADLIIMMLDATKKDIQKCEFIYIFLISQQICIQVNLVIVRMSGCIDLDRIIERPIIASVLTGPVVRGAWSIVPHTVFIRL